MSVSIPATNFENHNALMPQVIYEHFYEVHLVRFTGGQLVGWWLASSFQTSCGVVWASLVVGDSTRGGGSCETFRSFDQRALLCGENRKPWLLLLVCSLNIVVWQKESLWKSPILKSLSPVKSHPSWPHLPFNYILTNFSTKDPWKQNTNTTI